MNGQSIASGRAPTVLLVEDHAALLTVFQRVLEDAGYDVIPCDNGLDALAMLERGEATIDLLLSDIGLPGLRGDKLAVRAQRARPDVPIVLMTGYSEGVTPDDAATLGVAAVLEKPVTIEDLVAAVREGVRLSAR